MLHRSLNNTPKCNQQHSYQDKDKPNSKTEGRHRGPNQAHSEKTTNTTKSERKAWYRKENQDVGLAPSYLYRPTVLQERICRSLDAAAPLICMRARAVEGH